VVVLPEEASRIVTRELLYTGVTRAIRKVTIVGSRAVLTAAIETPIRRATGLAARLAGR
jgi:exodeoxyribonuclease V alpha subunit